MSESLIQAVEKASSSEELVKAVWALSRSQSEAAIPMLIKVLGFNNPGAAIAAVEGLVQLGDVAVPTLISDLDGYDYGARAWAIRALSRIKHPQTLEILLDAATSDFSLSVRRGAAKGLGELRWDQLSPEARERVQQKVLEALQTVAKDEEWIVRYAAIVGLESLARNAFAEEIREYLQQRLGVEADLTVRSRIQLTFDFIGKIGNQ
ncbi:HEAT repeat domain-containing protein [Dactylococcopsis salina]|uniref:PBS lyase HEAT-like repeat protein n=1 Tax=Dactylococcopsis salina (strain PCC 8305) TaxID=13035 RepID=K9YQM6_DACS8|nr:HEAT repeat domain-containing protein [Dactylococcopsis salina]AFZ49204.1 PBS lyase HEAT-like repeat protein [Dactylococcopsis salina PCC 8305]